MTPNIGLEVLWMRASEKHGCKWVCGMCVCVFIYLYICIYVYIYIYMCVCVCVCVDRNLCHLDLKNRTSDECQTCSIGTPWANLSPAKNWGQKVKGHRSNLIN